jgi:hypothetical protein
MTSVLEECSYVPSTLLDCVLSHLLAANREVCGKCFVADVTHLCNNAQNERPIVYKLAQNVVHRCSVLSGPLAALLNAGMAD